MKLGWVGLLVSGSSGVTTQFSCAFYVLDFFLCSLSVSSTALFALSVSLAPVWLCLPLCVSSFLLACSLAMGMRAWTDG